LKISSFFIINFLFVYVLCTAQTIPSQRLTDWKQAGCRLSNDIYSDSVNVMDFGAMGNGIANDYPAFAAAISSLNGQAGMVYAPAGIYKLNQTLHLPDSLLLKGAGAEDTEIHINTGENAHGIMISGNYAGNFTTVTGGFYRNSLVLLLQDSGLYTPGDYAEFLQDGTAYMTSTWAMDDLGQIIQIDSVSGFQIFLSMPLRMNYQAQFNPRIRKINPRKAVAIHCLKIVSLNPTSSQTSNIALRYASDCEVKGVMSTYCNFSHIEVNKSSHITVKQSYFRHGHSYGSGGKAYGICLQETSGDCLAENNIFDHLRHSILLQSGANGNVINYNYSRDPFWTGVALPSNSAGDMVLHGNYPYLNLFEGNICQHIVIDDSHGKNGPFNTFFRNRAELYGIFMNNAPATDSVNFVGNEVTNTGFLLGLYALQGNGHFQYGNNIKGTVTPSGTHNLNDTTYYYASVPAFWNISPPFPPIGLPSPINAHSNPARERYMSGTNLTPCTQTVITDATTPEVSDSIASFKILSHRAAGGFIDISIYSDNTEGITVFLYDLNGRLLIPEMHFIPVKGINTIRIPVHQTSSFRLLLLTAVQGNAFQHQKVTY
jgi:hypothetical protein